MDEQRKREIKRASYLKNKERNKEKKRASDRAYYLRIKAENPEKLLEQSRRWREENREKDTLRKKEFYKKDPQKHIALTNRWQKNNPEKRAAHLAVRYALNRGALKRHPCEICGSKKVSAHHHDYSKPLDVTWLCTLHHKKEHLK